LNDFVLDGDHGDIVLLGFPYDVGVQRNGGRIGARKGPESARKFIRGRMGTIINPEYNIDLRNMIISDAGDIDYSLKFEDAHLELEKKVTNLISNGAIPFVIGGGNDQSYPNACGLLNNFKSDVSVMNIDAHLDVRPLKEGKVHSGSPFRLLLEDSRFIGKNFAEFGIQGNQCSQKHTDYIISKGGSLNWLKNLRENKTKTVGEQFEEIVNNFATSNVFISFDIDVIISSDCPGVSAPATFGLSAEEAIDICFRAGKNEKVKLFDLSEFNPDIEEYRTSRLVTNMFYFFAMGVSERKKKQESNKKRKLEK